MQSYFPDFSSRSYPHETQSMNLERRRSSALTSFSLWKYMRVSRESDDFYNDSTRVLRSRDMEHRKQQPPVPCFKLESPRCKKTSRVKHKPQMKKDRRVGKKVKSRLRIGVHESSDGVVLDLRQLRAKRKRIMKRTSRAHVASYSLMPREGNFPALLLLKNHSLAHSSVKLFLRQMLDRYSDSLELIVQSNQIGCLPPPDQFIFDEEEISLSDSETYVDQQDWFMDVESQNYYISQQPDEPMDVLCVEDLKFFSEALGFPEDEPTQLIDL